MKLCFVDFKKRHKIIRIIAKIVDFLVLPLMFLFGFCVSSFVSAGKTDESILELACNSSCAFIYSLILFGSLVLVLSCFYLDFRLSLFLKKMEVFYNEGENDR